MALPVGKTINPFRERGWRSIDDVEGVTFTKGWYPILICWDPAEAVFPEAGYHDGEKWIDPPGPISHYINENFANDHYAKEKAYAHDPDM